MFKKEMRTIVSFRFLNFIDISIYDIKVPLEIHFKKKICTEFFHENVKEHKPVSSSVGLVANVETSSRSRKGTAEFVVTFPSRSTVAR